MSNLSDDIGIPHVIAGPVFLRRPPFVVSAVAVAASLETSVDKLCFYISWATLIQLPTPIQIQFLFVAA